MKKLILVMTVVALFYSYKCKAQGLCEFFPEESGAIRVELNVALASALFKNYEISTTNLCFSVPLESDSIDLSYLVFELRNCSNTMLTETLILHDANPDSNDFFLTLHEGSGSIKYGKGKRSPVISIPLDSHEVVDELVNGKPQLTYTKTTDKEYDSTESGFITFDVRFID